MNKATPGVGVALFVLDARRLGCGLLLIGWDERLGNEGFERRRRRVTGGAKFESPHMSRVQRGTHFEK
jgi:hypothetical protein